MGVLLLALALVAGPWEAARTRAAAFSQPAQGTVLQPTPAPPLQGGASGAPEQPPNAWLLVPLMFVCAMGGLLVVGVGAAILLVKLRERF